MKIVGEELVGTAERLPYEQILMELGYEFSIKNNVIQCRGEIYDNNKTI